VIIGIDYRFALASVRGIGRYIRGIVQQLTEIDSVNTYILYCHEAPAEKMPGNFHISVLPAGNIIWFEQVALPLRARKDRVDVLWYPSNSGPIFLQRKIRLAVTVHDLNFYPEKRRPAITRHGFGERYRKFALKNGLKRIDVLLTVSGYSQEQIRKRLCREAGIVYNCLDMHKKPEDDSVLDRFGLRGTEYVYSMTGEAPHKNLAGLLALAERYGGDLKFVISGVYHPAQVAALSTGNVLLTGRISEAEKSSLYKHAGAFIFIPYSEGFGIPVLEAMHYKLPVIASNLTAVPEVLGKGGELVHPDDHDTMLMLLHQLPWNMDRYLPEQERQLARFASCRQEAAKQLDFLTGKASDCS
jgi:glycosyltransferase involved in cell wall biosynthesis